MTAAVEPPPTVAPARWTVRAAQRPARVVGPEAGPVTLGLLADTHGWLDPALLEHFQGAAFVLHAGDVGDPEILTALEAVAPVVAVRGNIDGGALADLPLEALVEVAGRRVALRHIAGSPARPNAETRALVESARPDVLVVGHSHIPVAGRVGDLLWINPGAAGRHGFHDLRTAGLLRLDAEGEPTFFRIHLGPRSGRGA